MDNNHKERKGIITVPLFSSCSLVLTTSAGLTAAADIEPATIPGHWTNIKILTYFNSNRNSDRIYFITLVFSLLIGFKSFLLKMERN